MTVIKPQPFSIVPGLPNEQYHSLSKYISKSGLDAINKSPLGYKTKYLDGIGQKETEPMRIGKATHHFILEGGTFADEYLIIPKVRRGTNAWKEYEAEAAGRTLIMTPDFDIIQEMSMAVHGHKSVGKILRVPGRFEESFFGEIEGANVKCRPDWYCAEHNIAVDLKTAQDASKGAFSRAIDNLRYHVQAAFYIDVMESCGVEIDTFVFIAVEKVPPFHVAGYWLKSRALDKARELYQDDLETYKWCLENDDWFGYNNDDVVEIDLPGWAYARGEHDD